MPRRRRLARVAHPADLDPGLCGTVPARGRQRSRRHRRDHATHRGGIEAHARVGRRPPAAGPPRRAARHRTDARRSRRVGCRCMQRCGGRRSRSAHHPRCRSVRSGRRGAGSSASGDRQPRLQRGHAHARRHGDRGRRRCHRQPSHVDRARPRRRIVRRSVAARLTGSGVPTRRTSVRRPDSGCRSSPRSQNHTAARRPSPITPMAERSSPSICRSPPTPRRC